MMGVEINTILFYGPIGKKNSNILGGGETGNKRTISVLKKNSFKVIVVAKPYRVLGGPLGEIFYLFQLTFRHIYYIYKLFLIKGTKTLHLSGNYQNLIYFEYFMLFISKIFRVKTVYEIRACGFISSYEQRSKYYRYILRRTLNVASVILSQGYDDISFIKKICSTKVLYYPNYIMDDLISNNNIENRIYNKSINLIFLGRLVPSKGIDFIIDICNSLKKKNISFNLKLIGTIEKNYQKLISNKIKYFAIQNFVSFLPPQQDINLLRILKSQHFFLFPSKEVREGHSNSLTEAMICGVVPIASSNGFNRSVISNDNLIIEQFDCELYANKIIEIWNGLSWASYSNEVYQRVLDNYTETKVSKALINAHLI